MFQIDSYISKLIDLLKINFDKRLIYVGLQGSYLRGEANQNSDIDIMVVIDGLSVSDLAMYRSIIESLEDSDRSCGFICSKADLKNWNPLEIWNLTNGTKDYYGSLHLLVPAYSERDVRIFTKLSVNNLYHEMCHRYIHGDHDRTVSILPQLYKGTFFILQSLYYIAHGRYVATKAELLPPY